MFELERRLETPLSVQVVVTVGSIVLALLLGSVLLAMVGVNPMEAYPSVGALMFFDQWGWQDLFLKMTPLLLTGLGVAIAAQLNLWNIGAEGQLYLGAIATTWLALEYSEVLDAHFMLPILLIGTFVAGGMWAAIPAGLRSWFGVNEIITTLLLNYVAISLADYLLYGAWRDPSTLNFPMTRSFGESSYLPMIGSTTVHWGLPLGIILAFLTWVLLKSTTIGFQIRVAGDNLSAADYAGFNTKNLLIIVLVLSGAVAALAGMTEVAGVHHRLQQNFSINYGYTGIIVSRLARNHPIGVIGTAFLLAVIFVGGELLQVEYQLPIAVVYLFEGLLLFTVIGSELFLSYRLRRRGAV